MSALRHALERLAAGAELSSVEAEHAIIEIMDGTAAEAHIAAFLTALRLRGESPPVLVGAVRAVRSRLLPFDVPPHCRPVLDTCGTGGDGAQSVNISTAAAIVVSACGVRVVKHGNRSASGNSGSAEVLAELGVVIDAEPDVLARCLDAVGITFLFAPRFHPAIRHAALVRKQLPFRTLFNLVGPLVNPAQPEFQIIGVPSPELIELLGDALALLGLPQGGRAAVVHGEGGLDEVTTTGPTSVGWIAAGGPSVRRETWPANQFGLRPGAIEGLRVAGPAASAALIRKVLGGDDCPAREVILANAAAALLVAGRAANLREGVHQAAEAMDRGAAGRVLARWVEVSQGR